MNKDTAKTNHDEFSDSVRGIREARQKIAMQFRAECAREAARIGVSADELTEATVATIIRVHYGRSIPRSVPTEGHHTWTEPEEQGEKPLPPKRAD